MGRQFLNRSYTIAAFEHVWGKGMPERMHGAYFVSLAAATASLTVFCATVIPRCDSGLVAWFWCCDSAVVLRKDPLPAPILQGVGVSAVKCVRKREVAVASEGTEGT
jgi:hypothetical protein